MVLEDTMNEAEKIKSATKTKTVSNCGLVAEQMTTFKLAEVAPKLKTAIEAMNAYLQDTYKGVYCAICNGDYQKYFLIEKKQTIISEQFCRSILSKSLHVITYFSVHMKYLANHATTLVTKCSPEGELLPGTYVPVELNFVVDRLKKRELIGCLNKVNDAHWLSYCGRICEDFHITQISDMFEPEVVKFERVTKYIKTKLKKFVPKDKKNKEAEKKEKEEEKKTERILEHSKLGIDGNERILSEAKKEEGGEKKEEGGAEKKEEEGEEEDKKAEDEKKLDGEGEENKGEEQPKITADDNLAATLIENSKIKNMRNTMNAPPPIPEILHKTDVKNTNIIQIISK